MNSQLINEVERLKAAKVEQEKAVKDVASSVEQQSSSAVRQMELKFEKELERRTEMFQQMLNEKEDEHSRAKEDAQRRIQERDEQWEERIRAYDAKWAEKEKTMMESFQQAIGSQMSNRLQEDIPTGKPSFLSQYPELQKKAPRATLQEYAKLPEDHPHKQGGQGGYSPASFETD